MRRVRNQHFFAAQLSPVLERGMYHKHAGKFSMRSRSRLQGGSGKAANFLQRFLQAPKQLERALCMLRLYKRMQIFPS